MTTNTVLDLSTHQKISINLNTLAASSHSSVAYVVPSEFRYLLAHFPIVMRKLPETGEMVFNALLGFDEGENLFVEEGQWTTTYVPLNISREPFSVGINKKEGDTFRVLINMDDERVGQAGTRVFDDNGQQTEYLNSVVDGLSELVDGNNATKYVMEALTNHDLIEPLQLNITFDNGEVKNYQGLYTVNEDKLKALPADVLTSFNQHGLLNIMYILVNSLTHMNHLISLKNRRINTL